MVEANVKIIEELKYFLETVSTDPAIRKLVTLSENDFSRRRKLTFERLVAIIINLPKRSLSIEIQEFFAGFETGVVPSTKGAFSLQRTKLDALFFDVWNKWLVESFYHHYGDQIQRWREFRLLAVDGSTTYLLHKKDVIEYFGTHDNHCSSIPMARVLQIHDILNDLTIWGVIRPIKESEHAIIIRQVDQLYTDSITLFDRGYPSYALMYLMNNQETPRHFVMRCKKGFNKAIIQFVKGRKNSRIIELNPTRDIMSMLKDYGYIVTTSATLKVRLVKIKLKGGEVEILLTNLYDEKLYTVEDLNYLYGLRWGIETTFNKQKNQQQMEQFSGHRVICIQQDYSAGLFVANLQSLIEKQCENYLQQIHKKRKYRYKVNRNISWASLKHNIVKLFLKNDPEQILLKLQKNFERNIEPVRPGRTYPRILKAKRVYGKYQTLTNYKRAI
jgi:Transposase DDE domain